VPLSNAGTSNNNSVRADRNINTSYPLSGSSNLTKDVNVSLLYNSNHYCPTIS